MSSELPEGSLYVEVKKEDLAVAPPGVLEFLLDLYQKKDGRQDRWKTEIGLRRQQAQLAELVGSLTDTIQQSSTHDEALSWSDTLSKVNAFVAVVNALGARQSGDLGLPIGESLQKASEKTRQADDLGNLRAEVRAEVRAEMPADIPRLRAPGEASTLSFDRDVVMVNVPAEAAEHDSPLPHPLPKRKNKNARSPEILAKELTGSGATERIRRHVLAFRDTPAFPKSWDEQGGWAKQTGEILNLANEWDKKSELSKLVALILRTHGVECMYAKARSILHLDKEAPDPSLPNYIIDKVFPHLREKRTPTAFRRWLTLTRKLCKLVDYLPFIPFDGRGRITFRHYERLANEDIQKLRDVLDNNLPAQGLAKVGRAFRERILMRQGFLWEYISSGELSNLPDSTFLHLLTIRCSAEYDQLGGQSQVLASQPIARRSGMATGVCRTWTSEPSPSASASLRTTDYSPSAVLSTLVDSLAAHPLRNCNAFFLQEQAHVSDIGPQLQLPLRRRVPDTAQSIAFAMNGDIDGLKYLFGLGLASPRDESDSRGFSLLNWALYGGMQNYKTVQFLLNQGAYVDDESYGHVWDYRLRGKCSDTEQQALRCITEHQDRNWFDEQNFPLIHKIIFGLSPESLVDELVENPNAVSLRDAQGRTALDWATSRAQLNDMKLLIAWGSDPNTMDITGRTTVLHAVDSHNIQALRIVLEAGANPNPWMPKGLFRSSPITAASFGGLARMIELLARFGAKIDAANPEGRTALHAVAVTQNVECAAILLQLGANMDHVSKNGCTPLMTAIIHNKHAVLKTFLRYAGGLMDTQLLPIIAQHADSETMSILASAQFFDQ